MKKLKKYSTKELVNELIYREGVEMIFVDVMGHGSVTVDSECGYRVYASRQQGPEIILRITD